ncbi:MAG: AAA family ATPase, partial [Bacteroidales bacterium]|nr:AAA family ATPase [Bacteroidales bacterium]
QRRIAFTQTDFVRSIMYEINWQARLIGIKGARGVGKTTLLLQYIKMNFGRIPEKALYVSLDNIWFSKNTLSELADKFVKQGGTHLFLDEVHKYPEWSVELKNIYDDYPELSIVFTGSSMFEILNARDDLSRRAIVYTLQGLSFREYLNLTNQTNFKAYTLHDILENHPEISQHIVKQIKPLQFFAQYLKGGYYPFFLEQAALYFQRLEEVVNLILEIELPQLKQLNLTYLPKIKQLLYIIAVSAPFTPNISNLSERIGINRETLLSYLWYLNQAQLIANIYRDSKGITRLQKPDKLFLENTNLMFALSSDTMNTGNLRETFFVNQLKYQHRVEIAEQADFFIDNRYIVEIGGKTKMHRQIKDLENAFIAADDLEFGFENKIPLWLFGFLY